MQAPQPQNLRANTGAHTDPARLRRLAAIDGLLSAEPHVPLEVLDAVIAILGAAKAAATASVEARTLADLERLSLARAQSTRGSAPVDVRAAQIAALQHTFGVGYALRDDHPSQADLTMLGTRPLHTLYGRKPTQGAVPAANGDAEGEGAGGARKAAAARDGEERHAAQRHSKRFHFEPGDGGFSKYKLAEHDRGEKLYGPGARLGGYFVQADRRYDMQHDVNKHHGLPQYEGHNWRWDPAAGRYIAPLEIR
jgi:hypothetical protein